VPKKKKNLNNKASNLPTSGGVIPQGSSAAAQHAHHYEAWIGARKSRQQAPKEEKEVVLLAGSGELKLAAAPSRF
jgi:hypothetical protein